MFQPETSSLENERKRFEMPNAGDFMNVTGNTWENDGFKGEVGRGDVSEIGKFGINNDRVAFVDSNQDVRIGFATAANIAALEQAGYSRGSVGVPFSKGETPTHEGVAARMRQFNREGAQQAANEREMRARAEEAAAESAQQEAHAAADQEGAEKAKADDLSRRIQEGRSL